MEDITAGLADKIISGMAFWMVGSVGLTSDTLTDHMIFTIGVACGLIPLVH